MPALSKKQLRSLPTLTEVVEPADFASTLQADDGQLDVDMIVETVLQRLDLSLKAHIREVVESLVLTHIQEVEPRLKQKVSIAVRQAVAKTVTTVIKEQTDGKPKS